MVEQSAKPIRLWNWDDAPKELRDTWNKGGDEDMIVVVPGEMDPTDESNQDRFLFLDQFRRILEGNCGDFKYEPGVYEGEKVWILVATHA